MRSSRLGAILVLFVVAAAGPAHAQEVSQTLTLRPGWTAIYLEVQPEPREPEAVFAQLIAEGRLRSVWRFARSLSTIEFIQSPSEILPEDPNWLPFFPADTPEAFLTNLDEMQVNQPYLVNLSPGPVVQLTLAGRPELRAFRWQPDAFTLTGFPVDESSPASFAQFFEASPAHADGLIYALEPNGVWEPVVMAGPIDPGAAYWVFTDGASQHQGPIEVTPPGFRGVDFGSLLSEEEVRVRRRSGPATVAFDLLPGAAPVPLAYKTFAEITRDGVAAPFCAVTWLAFPAGPLGMPRPPCGGGATPVLGIGQQVVLILGPIRRDFGAPEVGSVLEVSNGAGVRWRVPVTASLAGAGS